MSGTELFPAIGSEWLVFPWEMNKSETLLSLGWGALGRHGAEAGWGRWGLGLRTERGGVGGRAVESAWRKQSFLRFF